MKGMLYALLAAFCNSCIGIFSSLLIAQGLSSTEIAFMRCFVALLFTFVLCMTNGKVRKNIRIEKCEIIKYVVLAFFGINVMYIFETTAIMYIPVSLVSFLFYSSGILTIILSCIFLKERMDFFKFISILIVFIGIGIMFISNITVSGSLIGIVFAIIAGTGYSLYIFLNKKWNILSDIRTLLYIFLFGTIFLGTQLLVNDTQMSISMANTPFIILLAIVPTMGGFYFTNKAISCAMVGEVQLIEMSEPFIATLLGYMVLNQAISKTDFIGGIIIVIGLLVLEKENIMDIINLRKKFPK